MAIKIPLALGNQAWDMMATAQQVDQCCGLGRGVNLFDNGYLGTGVINQRGITSETVGTISAGWHYTLDRWIEFSYGEWELTPDGLKLSNVGNYGYYFSFGQIVDRLGPRSTYPKSYPLTYSALIDDQVYSYTFIPGTDNQYNIPINPEGTILFSYRFEPNITYPLFELQVLPAYISTPITIKAIKLEIGTEQTLAHLEENNWVLNDPPPNPTLELLKCQRYQVFGNLCSGSSLTSVGGQTVCFLGLPIRLHKNPTIVGNPQVYSKATNASLSPSLIEVTEVYGNGCVLVPRGISEDCYIKFPDNHSGLNANL